MRKLLFIAAIAIALASCTKDRTVGDNYGPRKTNLDTYRKK